MKPIRPLLVAALASVVHSAAAAAHGGHPLGTGVPTHAHLHPPDTVATANPVLLALLVAGVAAAIVAWRHLPDRIRTSARVGNRRSA